ncbi:MAG TPA: Ig-like domain-containing protein [Dehalococcoidia bacterium]|nr:Ig-like domain-containing protein [Dehalococcoidia bacterium]
MRRTTAITPIRKMFRWPVLLTALVPLLAGHATLARAATITLTFSFTGTEQSFTVPANVTSIHVVAIGGSGGSGNAFSVSGGASGTGGHGALVTGDLAVTPGQTIYVEVGGNGANATSGTGGTGGFNGGGSGNSTAGTGAGGGGGGASDVRTLPLSSGLSPTDSRLLVAAGGGGGGAGGIVSFFPGGAGGNAGAAGSTGGPVGGGGGGAGTAVAGGAAGSSFSTSAGAGTLGQGGGGGSQGGAGAGGGLFGGGGGGGSDAISAGGGGGGGSNLVPAGGSAATDTTGVPQVTISYTLLGSSTTTVSSSVNPSTVGQPVTFTATVSCLGVSPVARVQPAAPVITPTGTVTFTIDGVGQPPVTLSNGVAAVTTSTLTVAGSPHSVSASYSGDTNCAASSGSLAGGQTVTAIGAGTTLTSSQNPSTLGQSVSFTATVSCTGFTPTGFITFTIDGTAQAPVALVPVNGLQQAAFTTAALGLGQHPIGAAYSGDANCAPSSATPLTQTVQNGVASTSVTLGALPMTGVAGQPVTLTAVVSSSDGSTPTGTVTFVVDGVASTPQAVSGGVATFTTGPLGPGPHTAQALYSGDATHSAAASAPLALQTQGLTLILNGFTLTYAVQGCGSITPPSEQGFHLFGDGMLVTAVPCPGSSFTGWLSGPCAGSTINPCAVVMPPNNLTITAAFTP